MQYCSLIPLKFVDPVFSDLALSCLAFSALLFISHTELHRDRKYCPHPHLYLQNILPITAGTDVDPLLVNVYH